MDDRPQQTFHRPGRAIFYSIWIAMLGLIMSIIAIIAIIRSAEIVVILLTTGSAVLSFVLAWGLWYCRRWAYWLLLAVLTFGIISALVMIFTYPQNRLPTFFTLFNLILGWCSLTGAENRKVFRF